MFFLPLSNLLVVIAISDNLGTIDYGHQGSELSEVDGHPG